ncbi:MAG TPA: single-stranded-DNA-specific exonuclease RecJ [Caldithrix abyssi]|uniref:Single-stranded-DNA-specific exonuclease RecJ n=1 Tax=Caldithrix abyssi TaxID=187145 RepID=A0A7V5RPL2_CALAY|nr:single-stranded-DNA-specific exonuclease RecJ [Caldithrix abyssi]
MHYQWIYPEAEAPPLSPFYKEYNVDPVIATIMTRRGISRPGDFTTYIHPSLENLHDPYAMRDMEKAVERLVRALENGENILVYGDYDVDGVTGVSILYQSLHHLGGKVYFFIPDRKNDGYGVTEKGITRALELNVSLIITVDCGITAQKQIAYAREQNVDVIVCDHHSPVGEPPEAFAILNPKQNGCNYPFKELAGCGVAFKYIQALSQRLHLEDSFYLDTLDLVALGTAADIVDLSDENRVLMYHGLKKINRQPREGISALIQISGLSRQTINVSLIVFILAPRLNAVGRISNAKKAVHLLTSSSPQQAKNIAQILNSENKKRRNIDEQTFQEAVALIMESEELQNAPVLVLDKEDWHLGVIGIVASRLQEKYNRPAILISNQNGLGKASARSTDKFNIFNALQHLQEMLVSYGGHACAAGMTIETEKIEAFRQAINKYASDHMETKSALPELHIDAMIDFPDLNGRLLHGLKDMEPYGPSNMRPVFQSSNVSVHGKVRVIGHNHLKFKLQQKGMVIDAIYFNGIKYLEQLEQVDKSFNFVYVIEESNWQGQNTIQLRIKDFKEFDGDKS